MPHTTTSGETLEKSATAAATAAGRAWTTHPCPFTSWN